MGWLAGMLEGYTSRTAEMRTQNQAEAEAQRQRETSIFQALLSSPDPETKRLAIAGMLHSGDKPERQGGLAGWVGKMRGSPYMPMIQALTPDVTTEEPVAPGASGTPGAPGATHPASGATALPHAATGGATPSLAQPETSPTEVGAPPPTPQSLMPGAGTPLPAVGGVGGTPDLTHAMGAPAPTVGAPTRAAEAPAPATRLVTRPRQVFEDPTEALRKKAIATQQGDVEGRVAGRVAAGMSREEALALERMNLRGGLGISHVEFEGPDGRQHLGYFDARLRQYIDAETQQPVPGAVPKTHTASTTLGTDREAIAQEFFGKRALDLHDQAQTAYVNAVMLQRKGQMTPSQALTHATTMRPYATPLEQAKLADELAAGTAAPPGPPPSGVGTAPPSVSAAAATPVASAVTASTPAATPTVAAPTATPVAGSAPPAPPTATTTAAPSTVRPRLSSALSPEMGVGNKETGKPLPPAVIAVRQRAEATNRLIDDALRVLEPYKNDHDPETMYKLATPYRQGLTSIGSEIAQLSDLAGLQAAAQGNLTSGSSRALQYFIARRQHVPILPSARQVEAHMLGIPSPIIGHVTRGVANEGSPDSPAQIYQKLLTVRANNQHGIDTMDEGTNMTKGGGVGSTPVAGSPDGRTTELTPQAQGLTMVNGKLHLNGKPY